MSICAAEHLCSRLQLTYSTDLGFEIEQRALALLSSGHASEQQRHRPPLRKSAIKRLRSAAPYKNIFEIAPDCNLSVRSYERNRQMQGVCKTKPQDSKSRAPVKSTHGVPTHAKKY